MTQSSATRLASFVKAYDVRGLYPDEIDENFGLSVEAEVTAVQNGQADWVFDLPPADRLNELGTTYASQVHVSPLTAFWYLTLNTNLAPFNNLQARQAINWAVDRNRPLRHVWYQIRPAFCHAYPPRAEAAR